MEMVFERSYLILYFQNLMDIIRIRFRQDYFLGIK